MTRDLQAVYRDSPAGPHYVLVLDGERVGRILPASKRDPGWSWSVGEASGTGRDMRECLDMAKLWVFGG